MLAREPPVLGWRRHHPEELYYHYYNSIQGLNVLHTTGIRPTRTVLPIYVDLLRHFFNLTHE